MRKVIPILLLSSLAISGTAWGATVHVTMKKVDHLGTGNTVGMIVFEDTAKGLRIVPNLHGLSEGQHGMHVHQNPSCEPMEKDGKVVPGLAAGGHFDPENTGKHAGPMGDGHLGDLPVLKVDAAGKATRVTWATRLKTSDLSGRAIIIHAGGDNYSDNPKKLGGGGARVACGAVVY